MTRFAGLVIAVLGCVGSSRPLLICHNANCAEGNTVEADDTLGALRASLALRTPGGEVVFDGMELDSVWDRGLGRCTFAHAPGPGAPDFAQAVALVAAHVAASAPDHAAHTSAHPALYLKIELKTDVGGGAPHTPDEVAAHVACVTAAARAVITAGVASHNVVVPIFDSDDPALPAAIDPGAFLDSSGRECLFETGWGTALPAGFTAQIRTLDWYDDPEAIDWGQGTRGQDATSGGSPRGLLIWARNPSLADLDAMLVHDPAYVGVNNIEEARGLLDAP